MLILGVALTLAAAASAAADGPRIVVSIKPIHSLIAAVTEGVTAPALLIAGGASPHAYSLRPSDARLLHNADVVFWVGPDLEAFLGKPLRALAGRAVVIQLIGQRGVETLPLRSGGVWDATSERPGHAGNDPHIWLDPDNAAAIARTAARVLTELDSDHADVYLANRDRLIARLHQLDEDLRLRLQPVAGLPYVVFHDAYQAFERHYGLNAVGSISVSPDRRPGIQRVQAIRRKIENLGARCVFVEPQFAPGLARALIEGTAARLGELDPIGAATAPGPDAYPALMRGLAQGLVACLSAD